MTNSRLNELKLEIVDSFPPILQHQAECDCGNQACKLNSHLMKYFLAREFEHLRPTDDEPTPNDRETNGHLDATAPAHSTNEVGKGADVLEQRRADKLAAKEASLAQRVNSIKETDDMECPEQLVST